MSQELHGVLVVDKPAGMTSAGVVARVKRALGARRAGHTGTLDPMATGVLPIVLGEGTKLAPFLLADDKEYEGELELGVVTDTLDAEGQVLERRGLAGIDASAVAGAMSAWVGVRAQVPPMHSALKRQGKRLYELARAGIEVDREPREVTITRFDLLDFSPPRARFIVACSKGTYVRALARDVGATLGCGATLVALRRTAAGRFTLASAVPLDQVAAMAAVTLFRPPDAVAHLPAIVLDDNGLAAVAHGQRLPLPEGVDVPLGGVARLLSPSGALAALAEIGSGGLAYLRVFNYGLTVRDP